MALHNRIQRPIDSAQLDVVRGTAHPMALRQFDQGRISPDRMISGAITFRLSSAQQADMDLLLREQQDRSSPQYHKWLTPHQYAQRFGMTAADLAKVTAWLRSQGLTVDGISPNLNEISFSGSVGQVEYALKTEIHNFSMNGEQHFANAFDVSFPRAFSAEVLGIRGLNDFVPKPRARRVSPMFTSNLSGNHFLIPDDFATIYNLKNLYTAGTDGSGQSIAVVGQTTISTSDLDAFRSNSGLPATSTANFKQIVVPNTGAAALCTGDEIEADLDLEWSEAIARNATIKYIDAGVGTGGSCTNRLFNVFDSLQYAITANVAPVISISYGNCEANLGTSFVLMMQQWAQQANTQGQTIVGPSGDSGAADCDNAVSASHGLAVDAPAALPEVTGVGGSEFSGDSQACSTGTCAGNVAPADLPYWSGSSSLTSGASALIYIPEKGWNDSNSSGISASGGGASSIFGKPSWQAAAGMPNDGKRDVPDVSLNASNGHDPYLICSQGGCVNGFRNPSGTTANSLTAVGGTSVGAPTFAGIVALLNQATGSNGLGNVNPMLYSLAATSSNAFHDITGGDNKVACTAGSKNCSGGTLGFTAGAGYDQVTGLGSLDVGNLVAAWVASTPGQDFAVDGLVSSISAPGQKGTSAITVTARNGFASTVNLTCAPASSTVQITCSLTPASVDLSSNNVATATLNIATVAELQPFPGFRQGKLWAASGGLFAAVLLGGVSSRRRWTWLLGLLTVAFLAVALGCGGGSSSSSKSQGTPAGTYTVTVTGTSGAISHSATVSVTVQ